MPDYSSLSLWLATFPGDLEPRPPLDGDTEVDVAIVGGGFTGLWTAYYLTERDPSLSIMVIEREICGFGASGRNGGWVVGELAADIAGYARRSSHAAARRLVDYVHGSVDEIARVIGTESIECGFAKGGVIRFARNGPRLAARWPRSSITGPTGSARMSSACSIRTRSEVRPAHRPLVRGHFLRAVCGDRPGSPGAGPGQGRGTPRGPDRRADGCDGPG